MEDIKKLRTMTGAGLGDCKKALAESNGNLEEAIEIIRKKGQAVAAKRSDREAAEGCVLCKVENGFGAIIALKCETDFVAKNEDFIALAQSIMDLAVANKCATLDEVKALQLGNTTVAEAVVDRSGITGEKMELDGYLTIEGENIAIYDHQGKHQLCTMVALNKKVDATYGKAVAMQVAAMNPVSLSEADVPEDIKATEFKVAADKAREEGKPENMVEKIAEGKLNKFFKESTLLSQEYTREAKVSVEEHLRKIDKDLTISSFQRAELGE